MRKTLGLVVAVLAAYLSCSDIAVSAPAAPDAPVMSTEAPVAAPVAKVDAAQLVGALMGLSAAGKDVGAVLQNVQVDPSLLPPWAGKALVYGAAAQGILWLLSTGLLKLGAATKNEASTRAGALLGQLAWGSGVILGHFGFGMPKQLVVAKAEAYKAQDAAKPATGA